MKTRSKFLSAALLLAALLLINFLVAHVSLRYDATAEKLYTLSVGTKSLLGKIEEPIQLDLYYTKGLKDIPLALKNYADRIQETLRQYARLSSGKITLNLLDVQPDSREEEKATAAGLLPQAIDDRSGESFFFGLVATQADQQKTIPAFSPQRESFLEYDLSQLIHSVQVVSKKRLGLLTGVTLRGQPQSPVMMRRQPTSRDQLVITEWSRNFEIVPIEPSATELPANLDALAVIHPQNLSDKLQYAIDQFVLSGLPTLIAVDPASQPAKRQQDPQMAMFGAPPPNASSDLPKLLSAYGISYDPTRIAGDPQNGTQLQNNSGQVFRHPAWISLTSELIARDNMATAQLDSLMFVETGFFTLKPANGVTSQILAQTSSIAGDTLLSILQPGESENLDKHFIPSGAKTLAALVTGKLTSAFPDGAPKDPAPATSNAEKKPDASAATTHNPSPMTHHLAESKSASTLLVIADTDWLLDDYSVRRMNFLGNETAEPLNDNLAFATNALEYLTGSRDLLSLRGKGNAQRPFTVVREMERQAQQKFQDRLQVAQTKLNEVQQKITELQGKKSDNKVLIANPEVTKAIEDFRRQESVMRSEIREIRRGLRQDIDRLGHMLLGLNLLIPILGVLIYGVFYHRQRRTA